MRTIKFFPGCAGIAAAALLAASAVACVGEAPSVVSSLRIRQPISASPVKTFQPIFNQRTSTCHIR